MPDAFHDNERRIAVSGVMYTGVGRGISILVEAAVAIALPALLGTLHYGSWVIFRSLFAMMQGFAALGTGVTSVHYVSKVLEGKRDDAKRLFKALLVIRLLLGIFAGSLGSFLLLRGGYELFGPTAPVMLFGCIFLRVVGSAVRGLLHGERQFKRLAATMVFQNCCTPVMVLLGYLAGGIDWIPASCLAGELLYFLVILVVCRKYTGWVQGWPDRGEVAAIVGFTWQVSLAQILQTMFVQSLPYVMKQMRMGLEQIAFVGLGLRLAQLGYNVLRQISGSLTPSVRIALETRGVQQVVVWKSLTCRLGVVLTLLSVGAFAFVGTYVVPWLWPDYAEATLIVLACLLGSAPRWVAVEIGSVVQVIERPGLFTMAVFCMIISFYALLYLLPAPEGGLQFVGLLVIAFVVFMLSSQVLAKRRVGITLGLQRLGYPVAGVGVAIWLASLTEDPVVDILLLGLWVLFFVALVFRGGSVKWAEISQILYYARKGLERSTKR